MSRYDFDEVYGRRGTSSYKWDTPTEADVIPMWVADMDFRTAPEVIDALRRRVNHGIFGYTRVPTEYYDALTRWFGSRHGWAIDREWVIYTSGVVPALSAIIKALTVPGDKVIVQTPAYNCFFSSIRNNGCELSANQLVYHEDGSYTIDFDDLERVASDDRARLMLLCNPHNPAGRVWTVDELRRVADICERHGVTIISDEIHCELTYPGHRFTPFAVAAPEVAAHSVVCNSPSKAFNTAGLQIANIIAPDPAMRRRIDRAINDNEVCDVNPFGVVGLIAAYNDGGQWLDELKRYLLRNYEMMRSEFESCAPRFTVTPLEGTYLAWVNIAPSGLASDAMAELLEREGRVMISPGSIYGPGGQSFIRINLAAPRRLVHEGVSRILDVLQRWQ